MSDAELQQAWRTLQRHGYPVPGAKLPPPMTGLERQALRTFVERLLDEAPPVPPPGVGLLNWGKAHPEAAAALWLRQALAWDTERAGSLASRVDLSRSRKAPGGHAPPGAVSPSRGEKSGGAVR
ncbi:MAG: hypothetical protein JSV86_05565 [Gemmatimonadota bacterium]|nr:MAG: hypothetical protein JSV86_05565 [Gemmatimonadota bacterium]